MLSLFLPGKTFSVFLSIAVLLNTTGLTSALKCYACESEVDCFDLGNLDNVRECENTYNTCVVNKAEDGSFSKYCWKMENQDVTEKEGAIGPGSKSYYCYSDLCNKGDYANGRPSSFIAGSGSSAISSWFTKAGDVIVATGAIGGTILLVRGGVRVRAEW